MFDGDLNTVGKVLDDHPKLPIAAVLISKKWEGFAASVHSGFRQGLPRLLRKAHAMSSVQHNRANRSQKARIVVQLQLCSCWVSGHWSPPRARRMPLGSPGNNTIHPRKVE